MGCGASKVDSLQLSPIRIKPAPSPEPRVHMCPKANESPIKLGPVVNISQNSENSSGKKLSQIEEISRFEDLSLADHFSMKDENLSLMEFQEVLDSERYKLSKNSSKKSNKLEKMNENLKNKENYLESIPEQLNNKKYCLEDGN